MQAPYHGHWKHSCHRNHDSISGIANTAVAGPAAKTPKGTNAHIVATSVAMVRNATSFLRNDTLRAHEYPKPSPITAPRNPIRPTIKGSIASVGSPSTCRRISYHEKKVPPRVVRSARYRPLRECTAPQHFLYFLPLPQGHGSFLPIFCLLLIPVLYAQNT